MPFVNREVDKLLNEPKVGNHDCVTLIKEYAPGLKDFATPSWRAGIPVKMNGAKIARGTAIATFVDGRYPRLGTGNHAAFFLFQAGNGFWVMDQWYRINDPEPFIARRFIRPQGKHNGRYVDPSNNADAFFVIELN